MRTSREGFPTHSLVQDRILHDVDNKPFNNDSSVPVLMDGFELRRCVPFAVVSRCHAS